MPQEREEYIGINWHTATPYAYVGKTHWNIKPTGITQAVIDELLETSDAHMKVAVDPKIRDIEKIRKTYKVAQRILTLTLDKFIWKKAANDATIGPALLSELAGEVKDFCLSGGKFGMQRLQMRSTSARSPSLTTSPDSKG